MSTIRVGNIGPLTGNTSVIADPGGAGGMSLVSMAPITASGTTVSFTGIPSWVRRVTVNFYNVSTSSTSIPGIQLGTSGGITTSGYTAGYQYGSSAAYGNVTSLLPIYHTGSSGTGIALSTVMILNLVDTSTNKWVTQGVTVQSVGGGSLTQWGGSIALSGALSQLRAIMVNTTDTFSAGTINVMYE
jgi:hypothetical protein